MKKLIKILSILLCFVMVFAAGCSSCNRNEQTPSEVPTTAAPVTESAVPESTEAEPADDKITQEFVDKAAEMVYEFYKPGHDAVVTQDFTLPSKVKYQGEDVDIRWEVVEGADVASVEMGDDGQWIVKLNKDSLGGPFKLKGIVSCGGFESEIEFDYTVVSQLEVLQRAYALEPGQSLDGTQVLTGVVTKVNTPYDESYKNVTVTIVVDGHDDMPIMCYRMKGDGADVVKVNDTITVSGTIKNYNGTIEFDAGCILVSIDVVGEEVPDNSPTFSSDREIVEAAYRLAGGDYLSDTKRYTLTGVVTKVNTPYDDSFKNVTVTIVVDGMTDKPIQCYRMKGDDADKVKVTDTIQVTGLLKNYVNASGKSTIEFDAGCTLDKIVAVGAGEAKVDYGTDAQIVDAAYALAEGENLVGEQTLTGVVTKINTPYDANYKNVTVTIVVAGKTDKPIQCYRMKGTDAEKVKVTDTIQVTGTLKNYVNASGKSTIEFDAGCRLDKIVAVGEGDTSPVLQTPGEIIAAAYALAGGDSLTREYSLTGKITKVNQAYDATYQNVSVTMVVPGYEDKPIYCYRIKGDGADVINVGYTITVNGILTNYVDKDGKSTIEYAAGSKLVSYTAGSEPIPEGPTFGSEEEIVNALYALGEGDYLSSTTKYTLSGEITNINTAYDAAYGNITVTIVVGNLTDKPVQCYRMKGAGDAMTAALPKLKVGDKITVNGILKDYRGTKEFDANCLMTAYTAGSGSTTPDEPVQDDKVKLDAVIPEAGKAYKLALAQQKLKKALYFDGNINNSGFLTTVEDAANGQNVYLEAVSGGYALYFNNADGSKSYITLTANGKDKSGHQKAKISLTETAATVYTINNTYKTLYTLIEGAPMYIGTYNTYNTFSASEASFLEAEGAYDVSQFPAQFILSDSADPEPSEPEEPKDKVENKTYTVDELLAAMDNYTDGQISGVECTVKGVVTSAEYSTQYSSYTIWLQNDDGTNEKAFELYSAGMSAEAGDYSQNPEDLVGKTVTCTGYVQLYKTTYEMPYFSAKKSPTGKAYTPMITAVEETKPQDKVENKTYTVDELLAAMDNYTDGQISGVECTVKGVVTSAEYSTQYSSYTIWLQNDDGTNEKAFELYSAGMSAEAGDYSQNPEDLVGKTVTCTGYVQLYKTTYEMPYFNAKKSPTGKAYTPMITAVEKAGSDEPEPLKEFYTPDEIVALMADYTDNQISKEVYTVKGVASSSKYSAGFDSYTVWLQSDDGTEAQKFELFSVGMDEAVTEDYKAENAMVGKTVTCSGYLKKYVDKNGAATYEMAYLNDTISPTGKSFTPSITAVEGETEPEEDTPYVQPEAGKAYKLVIDQKKAEKTIYFNGQTDASKSYWLLTTENEEDAVVVYAEQAEGGLNLRFKDAEGKNKYITIASSGSHVNAGISDAAGLPFTYNETYKTVYVNVGEKGEYFLGTYNTFTTISASSVVQRLNDESYDTDQFVVHFIETEAEPEEPEPEEP